MPNEHRSFHRPIRLHENEADGMSAALKSGKLLFHPNHLEHLVERRDDAWRDLLAAKQVAQDSVRRMLDFLNRKPKALKTPQVPEIVAALERTQAVFDAIDARPSADSPITEEEIAVIRNLMALLRQMTDEEAQTPVPPPT